MLVVLAPVAGISIVKLLAAAVVPGLLLSSLYIIYAMIRSYLNPRLGPPLPPEERASSYLAMVKELFFGIVPMAFLIFAALGSILAGLATPTEAAAMGALGALVLMLAYRRMSWQSIRQATHNTLQTSSMVLFLAVASNIYGSVFTRLGTTTLLAETLLALPFSPTAMLALLMLVIFILGWPLEWPVIVFIFVPIFLPVVEGLNFDLVWFCTLVAVNLQTAFLSPPVAMAAYYLKSVVPEWELSQIYRGMFEFMCLQVVGLGLLFFFPQIALWLPNLLYR
jgi:tripartite ATP-independent transporter DctM subunit